IFAAKDLFAKLSRVEVFLRIDGIGQGIIGPVIWWGVWNLDLCDPAQLSVAGVSFGPCATVYLALHFVLFLGLCLRRTKTFNRRFHVTSHVFSDCYRTHEGEPGVVLPALPFGRIHFGLQLIWDIKGDARHLAWSFVCVYAASYAHSRAKSIAICAYRSGTRRFRSITWLLGAKRFSSAA